jgi:hypothetical protein
MSILTCSYIPNKNALLAQAILAIPPYHHPRQSSHGTYKAKYYAQDSRHWDACAAPLRRRIYRRSGRWSGR